MDQFDNITLSPCGTFHRYNSKPLYHQRFSSILKFTSIGLAAVQDQDTAYHINIEGMPAYSQRYEKCYNFYQGLAAVKLKNTFFHIDTHGLPAYQDRFTWVGNFQEKRCVVNQDGQFYHIDSEGRPIYPQRYEYVGDFKEGIAVVYKAGLATHIDTQGQYLHTTWFKQLDVYHKGFARAEDKQGWFHINKKGEALYSERYKEVEPFYNDLAKVQTHAGALLQIDPANTIITTLVKADPGILAAQLSDDLVGFWKTFVIYTGVKLAIFTHLPATADSLAEKIAMPVEQVIRLLRALWEIKLLTCDPHTNRYTVTEKGQMLCGDTSAFLASAAILWAHVAAQDWLNLPDKLATPSSSHPSFKDKVSDAQHHLYLQALEGYAVKDVGDFLINSPWLQQKILGLGRSSLGLLKYLAACSPINAAVFVGAAIPADYLQGTSIALLEDLQHVTTDDDIGLSLRFLHYFDDKTALTYLNTLSQRHIKKLLIFETILSQDSPLGGLLDINMLMETGGKLRTMQQWQQLFSQTPYTLVSTQAIHAYLTLLELEL